MKCVVTGSSGFIGTALCEKLSAMNAEIRCLVRSNSMRAEERGVTNYEIDYTEPDSLVRSGALDDVDYVFHVAGVTKELSLEGFRLGNVVPTRHLVEALTRLGTPLERFVLISSQAAAGPASSPDRPVRESDAPAPVEDYGRSKLEGENVLRGQPPPFDYTIIRPSAVYGPQDTDFLMLFKQLKSGIGIYPGNRKSHISVIHVNDLVDGIVQAAKDEGAKNQTYFMSSDPAYSWHHIYEVIADIWGSNLREMSLPFGLISFGGIVGDIYSKLTGRMTVLNSKKVALARPKYWVCTAEKAKLEIGFDPKVDLADGLRETFDWYKDAGWL